MQEEKKEAVNCNGCEYSKGDICTNIQADTWQGRVLNMRACDEFLPKGLTEFEARNGDFRE